MLGWLVTVTSRMCIDRLRPPRNSRRAYVGPWLPEPVVEGSADIVGDQITLDDSVRMALLVVLDRLTPGETGSPSFSTTFLVFHSPKSARSSAARRKHVDSSPPGRGVGFRATRPPLVLRQIPRNIERLSNGSHPPANRATSRRSSTCSQPRQPGILTQVG